MITCKSCGGTFAPNETRCPYCGTMYLVGATEAYNQKFEDMTDNLADLGEDEVEIEEYKEAILTQGKHTLKYFAIAGAIVSVFVGLFMLTSAAAKGTSEENAEKLKAQLAWQAETFPMLDELYEAGDYDAVVDFQDELIASENENNYTIYQWDHYDFIDVYCSYRDCLSAMESYAEDQTLYEFEYKRLFHFSIMQHQDDRFVHFTEKDKTTVAAYRAEVATFLEEVSGISAEDTLALYEKFYQDDEWVSYGECSDYIEEYLAAND